jgi:hypothetical protein
VNGRAGGVWHVALVALASCQVVTGLDGLQIVDAGEHSSSSAVSGSDAGVEVGPDGTRATPPSDARCRPPLRAACDLVTQCGCTESQHCQARPASYVPACFAAGTLEPGGVCKTAADCPRGQTCDDRTCRAYCREDSDCSNGICVGLQTKDAKARSVRVCWAQCSPDDAGTCGPGARCRTLQNERGESSTYCAAPADPCPSTEDGACDDSRGTGQCADGSDQKDCDCTPRLPDAACDAVAQCGCPKGEACAITREAAKVSAACAPWSGDKQDDAPCKEDAECAPGYVCQFGGTCSRLCTDDAQCGGRSCLPVALSGKPSAGLQICYARCDRMNPACPAGTRCAHFDSRFEVQGDYCIAPVAKCPAADGVCDEARGSGLCMDETDVVDCCQSSLMGGECDLVRQCGCEKKPGTSCVEGARREIGQTSVCQPSGSTRANEWCLDDAGCGRGLGCAGHVCRAYCNRDADCEQGGRCISKLREDVNTSVKVCLGPCSPETDRPCGDNTRCTIGAGGNEPASGCTFVPLTTTCPTNNGRCDEPEGTGICAEASDPADCAPG